MYGKVECPYCHMQNQVDTKDWDRVKCYNCEDVFYVEVVSTLRVSSFVDNGEGVTPTIDGDEV